MEFGVSIFLVLIGIAFFADYIIKKIKRCDAYIRELEKTNLQQKRSLQHYRFLKWQEEQKSGDSAE